MSDSRVSSSKAQAATAGRRTEYVVDTTSWEESLRAFTSSSQLWREGEGGGGEVERKAVIVNLKHFTNQKNTEPICELRIS